MVKKMDKNDQKWLRKVTESTGLNQTKLGLVNSVQVN